jgi:uncharacterized membrane protein
MNRYAKRHSRKPSTLLALIGGAAVGAAAMYLSDPDRGKRRRAVARDKMQSIVSHTSGALDVASRDLGNRVQGLRAQANRMLRRRGETADDDVLEARVRSKIGRAISHAHAIKIQARGGCVHVSGPVLAHEKKALLSTVRSVHGVTSVEDHTEQHEEADIPGLQGEGRVRSAPRMRIMQDNWPPGLRAIAAFGGGSLGVLGLVRRTPASFALAAAGMVLIARSVSNMPLLRAANQRVEGERVVNIHETIHIAATPETVYDAWRNYENFPRFMSNVKEVRDLGEGRSHWTVSGPAGTELEWQAMLTEDERGRMLAWQSMPDSMIEHAGSVEFIPEGDGTLVGVSMSYFPHATMAERAAASVMSLFNGDPTRQMMEDLRRMKVFIESGMQTPPTEAGTASAAGEASKTLH